MTEPDTPQERARSIFDKLRASSGQAEPAPESPSPEIPADHSDGAPAEDETGSELPSEPAAEQTIESESATADLGPSAAAAGDWLPETGSSPGEGPESWLPEAEHPSSAPEPAPHAGDGAVLDEALPASPTAEIPTPSSEAVGSAGAAEPAGGTGSTEGTASTSGGGADSSLVPGRIAVPPDLSVLAEALAEGGHDVVPDGPPAVEAVDEFGRPRHPAAVAHSLPRCLAVANQKGGVGKTTTTVNLGASLAELGYRVLVIDLDPQGNATTGLGVNARNLDSSVYDVMLHDVPVEDVIEPTTIRNLFIVPATIDLAGAEIELVPVFSRELRLRKALEPVEADFDFVLIDCPPSLGLLTVNALAAAGEVLVPIQCEYYALEGLGQLLRNVNLVQSNLNSRLEVSTIVLTMYDARTKLAEQVAEEVRSHFGARVCRNVVPRTVRLSEAPSFGQPVITFDSSSRGAIAYRELAKEVSGGAPQRVR